MDERTELEQAIEEVVSALDAGKPDVKALADRLRPFTASHHRKQHEAAVAKDLVAVPSAEPAATEA